MTNLVVVDMRRTYATKGLVLLKPRWGHAVQDLFTQPHEADEGTECASDHETALQAIGEEILTRGDTGMCGMQTQTAEIPNDCKNPDQRDNLHHRPSQQMIFS